MRFVLDMNVGAEWIACLARGGHQAVHWSAFGASDESDDVIMRWARDNDHIVLTADLDFGILLVRSREVRPSVVQLRTGDTLVRRVGDTVLAVLADVRADLAAGALVTIETGRYRIRRLSQNS